MHRIRQASFFAGLALVVGCGLEVVGSRYVKTQRVVASQGGVFSVSAAENAVLSGTRLEIPAAALSADTTVTVELGLLTVLGAELAAGPSVVFGPGGTEFVSDATLTLPLTELGQGDDVSIVGQTANGATYEVDSNLVALNGGRTLATFHVRHLGTFQPRRRAPCNASCATGLTCVDGRCVDVTSSDSGTPGGCAMTCPTGTSCDPTRNVCVSQPTQCVTTQNCPTNFTCVDGLCTLPTSGACSSLIPCPAGKTCRTGQCVTSATDGGSTNPGACAVKTDCPSALEECVGGVCRVVCTARQELCNNLDDDCDGRIDNGCTSVDGGVACGGLAQLTCPANMNCVDDATDSCVPSMGGVDCLGFCRTGPTPFADAGSNSDAGVGQQCSASNPCPSGLQCMSGTCH